MSSVVLAWFNSCFGDFDGLYFADGFIDIPIISQLCAANVLLDEVAIDMLAE